jgi:hypothetical protein
MKIISVQFDYGNSHVYDILAKVLEYSIKKNCPKAALEMHRITAPKIRAAKKCFDSNTVKIDLWLERMRATNDNIVFMDCDMLMLREISDVFNDDFDIGLTVNGTGSIPYNGGVVFVKNTPAAHAFIELWCDVNRYLYNHPAEHNIWRNKKGYAGMNQAALGCLLETKKYDAKIKKYQCSEWNLCRNNWRKINTESRILHVKSELRRAVMGNCSSLSMTRYYAAITTWLQYAQDAGINTITFKPLVRYSGAPSVQHAKAKLQRRRRYFEKTMGRNYTEIAKNSKTRRR